MGDRVTRRVVKIGVKGRVKKPGKDQGQGLMSDGVTREGGGSRFKRTLRLK